MLVTVEGIVIGKRAIGETSYYLDVLTEEYGVIEVVAHGVKKITNKNAGSCVMFSYSKFCLIKAGVMYTLNSAEPKCSFHSISKDIEGLSLAVYFSDLIKATSLAEQEAKGFLRFLAISFYEIEVRRIPLKQIKAVFELRLASELGFSPDLRACRKCVCYEHEKMYFNFKDENLICGDCLTKSPDGLYFLPPALLYAMRFIIYSNVDKIYRFEASEEILDRLAFVCENYLLMHLDRGFKSLDYYKNVRL